MKLVVNFPVSDIEGTHGHLQPESFLSPKERTLTVPPRSEFIPDDMIKFRVADAAINETVETVDVHAIRVKAVISSKIGEVILVYTGSKRITTGYLRAGQRDNNREVIAPKVVINYSPGSNMRKVTTAER